jgi:hypothetical protein
LSRGGIDATPEVDDRPASKVRADPSTDIVAALEVGFERILDRPESPGNPALDDRLVRAYCHVIHLSAVSLDVNAIEPRHRRSRLLDAAIGIHPGAKG